MGQKGGKIQSAFYESLPVILPVVESQVSLSSVLYGRYLSSSRWMDGRVTYCLMAFLRSFSKFNSVCSPLPPPLFLQFWRVVAFTGAVFRVPSEAKFGPLLLSV